MAGFNSPNYTQAPNVFFDEMIAQMGEAELRVALVIMRETFGWHRQSKLMSLSYLMKATGMSKQGVRNGIMDGIARGIICQEEFGNSYKYSLVVNEVDQNARASQRSRPVVVHEVDHLLVNEVDTTNKEKKKGEIKTTTPPATRRRATPEHMVVAEKHGLTPRQMTALVDAVLEVTGQLALANTDSIPGQRALSAAQEVAGALVQMGKRTPEDVHHIYAVFKSHNPTWHPVPSQIAQFANHEMAKPQPTFSEERRGVNVLKFSN